MPLVGIVGDRGPAIETAQDVSFEQHVGAAVRARRPEIEFDGRQRAARLVRDVRIQIGAAAELVLPQLVLDEEGHRRRQVDHRAMRRVDGAEPAFERGRREATEDVSRRIALDDLRRRERLSVVGLQIVRLVDHEAADQLEDLRRADDPVVVEARQRSAFDQCPERGGRGDLRRRAAKSSGRRAREEAETAIRPDGATEDGVGLNRPVVLQADLQPVIVPDLRGRLHEPEIASPLDRQLRVVERLVGLDAPVGREKPEPVPDDRSAERQIGLVVLALVHRNALDVRIVEPLRNHEQRRRSVEDIPAALRDDVHVLADHAGAVRCLGAERLHFDVLNRVVIQIDGENVSAVRIGDVGAIEARAALGSGQFLRGRIHRHSRDHQPRVLKAPARRHRHRGQRLVVDVHRQPGPLRIDDRSSPQSQ